MIRWLKIIIPVGIIADKAVCRSIFLTTYFECRINKKSTPSDCFFDDFAHWDGKSYTLRSFRDKLKLKYKNHIHYV